MECTVQVDIIGRSRRGGLSTMSFTFKIRIGLALGILTGIFLGVLAALFGIGGGGAKRKEPRWSVIRDVLHWVD
jgi:hypothetical protein